MICWLEGIFVLSDCQWTLQVPMSAEDCGKLLSAALECIETQTDTEFIVYKFSYGELGVRMLTVMYGDYKFVIPVTNDVLTAIHTSLHNIKLKGANNEH